MKKLMSKMRFLAIVLTVAAILSMAGCTYGFPDGYDKEECIKKCEEIIGVVNTKDYEAIHSMIREDLQDNVSAKDFEDAWGKKLNALGAFKKFGNPVLSGETDFETGEDFAMIAYYCYYEKGEAVYTIYFDSDMEMTSIAMKLD